MADVDRPPEVADGREDRRLLTYLAVAMVATGQPVHEIEEDLAAVGRRLGHPDLQVAAGPTGVTLALGGGEPATVETVAGPLRLDQAAEVRLIRRQLLTGAVDRERALARLTSLRGPSAIRGGCPPSPGWSPRSASVSSCSPARPTWRSPPSVRASCWSSRVSARGAPALATQLPSVAAFVVACLVCAAASAGLADGALRTLLPPLAILLPGAVLVTGLSEIAAGAIARAGPGAGSSAGFAVVEFVGAIALGLLVGSVLARSLRAALRRSRRRAVAS